MADPRDNPGAYDHPTFDGKGTPGARAQRVSGGERSAKVEQVQSPGFAGAFTKPAVIEDMATVSYRIDCANQAERAETRVWLEMLRHGQKQRPKCRVYQFFDPALEHCEIHNVIVKSLGGWDHDKKSGMWSVVVAFAEYKRPVPLPTGAGPRAKTEAETKIERAQENRDDAKERLANMKKGK